jgi:hypothetical protein
LGILAFKKPFAGDVMRFERKPQDFQYGKTPLSLAFLAFCMGSF